MDITNPNFEGKKEESTEGHLEMIQSAWVYEWRIIKSNFRFGISDCRFVLNEIRNLQSKI
jgi:hypothetical protein